MLSVLTATRCSIKFSRLKVVFLSVRKFMPKTEAPKKQLFDKIFRQPCLRDLEKSQLIPEGYKVVYISRIIAYLNFGHLLVFLLFAASTLSFRGYFTDPDWLNKEAKFGKINPYLGIMLLTYAIMLNFLLIKCVRIIFRKGDQFKYMYCGTLGPLRKKYVDYNANECILPKENSGLLCTLKGRKVWIARLNFNDPRDLIDMCKSEDNDNFE